MVVLVSRDGVARAPLGRQRAASLPDVRLVLVPEVLQRRQDGRGCRVAERAQRFPGDVVRDAQEQIEIAHLAFAALDALHLDDGTDQFPSSNLEFTAISTPTNASNVIPGSATAQLNIRFNNLQRGADLLPPRRDRALEVAGHHRRELGEAALRRPPEEVALTGGPFGLRRTIVSVRVNPGSPYRIGRRDDGTLGLSLEGGSLADVTLPPMPEYYRHTLAGGKTVMETAPTIQWGYLIYLTVLRLCQYFGAHEECGFCDINHNWRQHKKAGRPYTGVKPVEDVLEALALIDRYDTGQVSKAYTLTGGSVTSTVDGLAEADFYGRYAQAIEERFPGRWIGKVVAQALPKADAQRFKDYGIAIYHPNYEVWDKRLFSLISPGKERYVGREEWHRRILDAAEIFGPANVIPNFVAGVELARPFGFETIDEAIASTTAGMKWSYAPPPRKHTF